MCNLSLVPTVNINLSAGNLKTYVVYDESKMTSSVACPRFTAFLDRIPEINENNFLAFSYSNIANHYSTNNLYIHYDQKERNQ